MEDWTCDESLTLLVTGAAGFIGSHLCERLLVDGHRVVGLDNFLTGRRENLEPCFGLDRFSFVGADVAKLPNLDVSVDWIYHLASPASPEKYQKHPLSCMRANSRGTWHLLEFAERQNAGTFLASTSEVYGNPEKHPQPESYAGEVHPTGPRSVYDESKRFAETLVHEFGETREMPVRIARIFNTYGPRMAPDDGRVVSNFICQALRGDPLTVYGEGRQTRSFQYVEDLIEGLVRLREIDYRGPVNLGNPDERSIRELADLVLDCVPGADEIEFRPLPQGDPDRRRPDTRLAERLLDWSPQVSLREGLRRTIEHYSSVLDQQQSSRDASARPRAE